MVSLRACVALAACLALIACDAGKTSTASTSPSAVSTRDPGNVNCPDGKSAVPGLENFGAYIGTWQAIHHKDPQASSEYTIRSVHGRIAVRCSTDDYVIVEQVFLDAPATAAQALRIALNELPNDAKQVYDHTHSGCRTLQYESQQLAQQLGPDDNDGRVDITFEGDGGTFDASAVTHIFIDMLDKLGDDSQGC